MQPRIFVTSFDAGALVVRVLERFSDQHLNRIPGERLEIITDQGHWRQRLGFFDVEIFKLAVIRNADLKERKHRWFQ